MGSDQISHAVLNTYRCCCCSVHELNGYYYSVWKTRAGRLAEEYALLCETDGDPVKFR